ncbi:MAG: phosphoribosylformylglycinamidine synthase subunit PurQ [Limisphaerales bacterium]
MFIMVSACSAIPRDSSGTRRTRPSLGDTDCVIVPGGFSYGDYLRCGAIARFSPVMQAVKQFTDNGGLVLGICNGFQVLTEAGLLPGRSSATAICNFIAKYFP